MTYYGKFKIAFDLKVETGMHIGGEDIYAAIGSADSLVVRDVQSNLPMIPGSSLKGKLRYLLNLHQTKGKITTESNQEVIELFGGKITDKNGEKIVPTRLLFADSFVKQNESNHFTEVKSENTINHLTGVANPRQIERVVRGTVFKVELLYNIPFSDQDNTDTIKADFDLIKTALKELSYDYLGGHGSRGYGRVSLANFDVQQVTGNLKEGSGLAQELQETLTSVN